MDFVHGAGIFDFVGDFWSSTSGYHLWNGIITFTSISSPERSKWKWKWISCSTVSPSATFDRFKTIYTESPAFWCFEWIESPRPIDSRICMYIGLVVWIIISSSSPLGILVSLWTRKVWSIISFVPPPPFWSSLWSLVHEFMYFLFDYPFEFSCIVVTIYLHNFFLSLSLYFPCITWKFIVFLTNLSSLFSCVRHRVLYVYIDIQSLTLVAESLSTQYQTHQCYLVVDCQSI